GAPRLVGVAVERKHRGTGGEGERYADTRPRVEPRLRDRGLQLEPLALGFLRPAPGKHDDELVAGVARAHVVWPDRRAQHLGDLAQRAVADVMAVGIVDRLELVDVHHDERDLASEPFGTRKLPREMRP